MLLRADAIPPAERAALCWPWCARAATLWCSNGPATQQDRWEEDGGYSPFTLAVEISALLAAAESPMAAAGEGDVAGYLRETADGWNEQIDDWTYAVDTELSRQLGVDGYYMRIGYVSTDAGMPARMASLPIKNRADGNASARGAGF